MNSIAECLRIRVKSLTIHSSGFREYAHGYAVTIVRPFFDTIHLIKNALPTETNNPYGSCAALRVLEQLNQTAEDAPLAIGKEESCATSRDEFLPR